MSMTTTVSPHQIKSVSDIFQYKTKLKFTSVKNGRKKLFKNYTGIDLYGKYVYLTRWFKIQRPI